ncbi:Voltage-dependent chloride channel 1 [Ranunculus cassubicifolius]
MKSPITTPFLNPPHNLLPISFPSNSLSFKKILCSQQQQTSTPTPLKLLNPIISLLSIVPDWADGIKEARMQQRRTLYSHEDWVQHRSSLRHIRHLASSFSSRVILSLIPPVVAFTSFAAVIAIYNSAVLWEWVPEYFPLLRTSSLPYQLTAPALALLLVFRTEASYSRFEEGRKAWTMLSAGIGDFGRQVMTSVDGSSDVLIRNALLQYIIAFPVALKCHVIYGSDAARDLQSLLDEDDLALVLKSKNRPRCIIEFISQSLQILSLDESTRNLLESKFASFHEGIAVCEHLIGIPIPLSYTRLTSRILVLWHLTLPVILWDDCKWIVVPATFISAASLFCIEEVGVLIEEPFPNLALDEVCKQVREGIQEAMVMQNSIKAQLLAKQKAHIDKQSSNGRPTC